VTAGMHTIPLLSSFGIGFPGLIIQPDPGRKITQGHTNPMKVKLFEIINYVSAEKNKPCDLKLCDLKIG